MRRLREFVAMAILGLAIVGVAHLRGIEQETVNFAPESDPLMRCEAMLEETDNLRLIRAEWRGFWNMDVVEHATYERVHGGIGP